MTKLIKNLNIAKFDTLQIEIPLNQVKLISPELTEKYRIVYESGEYTELQKQKTNIILYPIKGIQTSISIRERAINLGKSELRERTLILKLSAKFLKENYFQGITKDNIKDIYEIFQSWKIFQCSYQTFLQAKWRDIDICQDRYMESMSIFNKSNLALKNQCIRNQHLITKFNRKGNHGIMFNKRASATKEKPFHKIYSKEDDLNKSEIYKQFRGTYLKQYKIENLIRSETTIKNKNHYKSIQKEIGLPNAETLEEILQLEQSELKNIMANNIKKYLFKTVKKSNLRGTPTNQMFQFFIEKEIERGTPFETIINLSKILEHENKQRQFEMQSKMKTTLIEIYDKILHESDYYNSKSKENNYVQGYFKWLGI